MSCPPLETMGRYAVAVVDPPWPLGSFGYQKHKDYAAMETYDLMTLDEIKALPVASLLDDDAFVFLWVTNTVLRDGFACLDAWGVNYLLTMTWVKPGGIQTPVSPCFNAEWVLVGKKGKPRFTDIRQFSTANCWPRAGHSAKPEGFYDLLRRVTEGPRIDVFNRRAIAGFQGWGHESPMDAGGHDHYQEVLL